MYSTTSVNFSWLDNLHVNLDLRRRSGWSWSQSSPTRRLIYILSSELRRSFQSIEQASINLYQLCIENGPMYHQRGDTFDIKPSLVNLYRIEKLRYCIIFEQVLTHATCRVSQDLLTEDGMCVPSGSACRNTSRQEDEDAGKWAEIARQATSRVSIKTILVCLLLAKP